MKKAVSFFIQAIVGFLIIPAGLVAQPQPFEANDKEAQSLERLGTPSFDERFGSFDHGTDQSRPRKPHRWRTVYGHGGPNSSANRQMSAGSFAADPEFAGMTVKGPGGKALGLNPFAHQAGQLSILAYPTPAAVRHLVWNKPYYGGAITTKFSFAQKFGYFEIEAKLPAGKGMWPAFWLMPVGGTWPDDGEIDVMEGLGDPKVIYCTVIAGQLRKSTPVQLNFDASADFHRYGVLWGEREMVWFVDRKAVARAATPKVLTNQPAYIIANLAVGGSWGGYPDEHTVFPGQFVIRRIAAWPYPSP